MWRSTSKQTRYALKYSSTKEITKNFNTIFWDNPSVTLLACLETILFSLHDSSWFFFYDSLRWLRWLSFKTQLKIDFLLSGTCSWKMLGFIPDAFEICSKLTIKTSEWSHWRHIANLFLVFPLLSWACKCFLGCFELFVCFNVSGDPCTLSTQIELNEAVRLYHVNQESQLVINSKCFDTKVYGHMKIKKL